MTVNKEQIEQKTNINQVVDTINLVKSSEVEKIGFELINFIQNNAIITKDQQDMLDTLEDRSEVNTNEGLDHLLDVFIIHRDNVKKLEYEITEIKKKLMRIDLENDSLKIKLKDNNELQNYILWNAEKQQIINQKEKDIEILQKGIKDLNITLQSVNKEKEKYTDKITHLERKITELQNTVYEKDNKIKINPNSEENICKLKLQLEIQKDDILRLQNQNNILLRENKELKKK